MEVKAKHIFTIRIAALVVLALAITVNTATAQTRTSSGDGLLGLTKTQIEKARNIGKDTSQKKPRNEYALYRSINKKNGWFVGIGPQISAEEASYQSYYYRLSAKNQAGNWTHAEALDGYGNLTTRHNIRPIAMPSDNDDSGADTEWMEKLGEMCQWYFTYDGRGERVTMETSCDKDGNALCLFRPVQINDSTVIGTYLDDKGRPANLRKNDTGVTLVRLTNDAYGFIGKVEILDGNGQVIKNQDEVYASRHIHDKNGFEKEFYSIDPWGRMMIDKCLNCGMEHKWDKKRGVITEIISFNDRHEYEKVPARNDSEFNIEKVVYEYDNHCQQTAMTFYHVDGTKDTIDSGAHRIEYKYNRHGKCIEETRYGIDGKLHNSRLGAAKTVLGYDNAGRNTLWATFDDKGNPVVATGNLYARQEIKYDSNGNDIAHTNYSAENGKLIMEEQYEKEGDTETYHWRREYTDYEHPHAMYKYYQLESPRVRIYKYMCGIIMTDSLDERENEISREYRDSLGNLVMPRGDNYTYAYYKVKYQYDGEDYTKLVEFFDENGNLIGDHARQYAEYDATTGVEKTMAWGTKGEPKQFVLSPKEKLDNDWLVSLSQLGNPSRTEYDGTTYYKQTMKRDASGNVYAWGAVNEWDEPAYLSLHQGKSGYVQNNNRHWYDENSQPIIDENEWALGIPKVISIECIDKKAFDMGFRDNDIIVQYGDYYYPVEGDTHIEDVLLAMIMNSSKEKTVRVLRHDVKNRKSKIVTIPLKEGRLSDFGVAEHVVLYTQRELGRLTAAINDFKLNNAGIEWKKNIERKYEKDEDNSVNLVMPSKETNANMYYTSGLKDANIIINYFSDYDTNQAVYVYCDDFKTVKKVPYTDNSRDYRYLHITLTDEEYKTLNAIKQQAR